MNKEKEGPLGVDVNEKEEEESLRADVNEEEKERLLVVDVSEEEKGPLGVDVNVEEGVDMIVDCFSSFCPFGKIWQCERDQCGFNSHSMRIG